MKTIFIIINFSDFIEEELKLVKKQDEGYIYTRIGNPTTKALEDCVAALENGCGGMAAITTVYLSYLSQGDHLIGAAAVYGPTRTALEREFSRLGVEADFVDTADVNNITACLRPETKMLFIETPANPTLAGPWRKSLGER